MSIRIKALIVVILTATVFIAVLYFFFSVNLLNNFSQLEQREVEEETRQAVNVIQGILEELDRVGGDWAPWDETYQFVEDGNEAYIRFNLSDDVFENLRLNLMLFIHTSGRVVYGKMYDLENHREIPLPAAVNSLATDPVITDHTDTTVGQTGIFLMPDGPLFLSAWPISDSLFRGPIRGTLVVGRYLTSAEVERLSALLGYPLSIYRADQPEQMPADVQMIRSFFPSALPFGPPILVHLLEENLIAGYALLEDIHGNPAIVVQVRLPRAIYQQGREITRYYFFSLLAIGIAFSALSAFLLERVGIARLTRLSTEVDAIGATGDLSRRVLVEGRDELARLAMAINGMLEALQRAQQERQRLEQHLIQTERITAMGQLAAALMHEINNPLHSVWTTLELVTDFPIDEAEKQEYLQAIRREVRRLMNISRRVLDFTRPSRMERSPVMIADVIRYALDLAETRLRERRIQVTLRVPDRLPPIVGSPDQLTQVFLNIILNAVDAMPDGGRLDIAASAGHRQLRVTITDTGPGIPPEVMSHLFEPFFTTKKSGTGLGLAISQGIIQQHGGVITAANAPQGGAVFTVTLPASDEGL